MTRIAPIVALALTASAFTPPTQSRPPSQLAAGFGKTTKSKDKAVQIKGAPKPMDKPAVRVLGTSRRRRHAAMAWGRRDSNTAHSHAGSGTTTLR